MCSLSLFFTEIDCVWYEIDAVGDKSLSKHNKIILKSAKHAPIREHLNDSSKLFPLKFNQSAVGPMEGEDSRELINPVNDSTSQHQIKKRNLLKRTHSFQPCDTCQQIVQQRKSFSMLSYRSTPHPLPVTPQLDTQPTIHSADGTQAKSITSDTCASKFKVKTASLLRPEKSTLLQSKERIEGVLKMKRRQLQFLVSSFKSIWL